jgi:hypothetical protein
MTDTLTNDEFNAQAMNADPNPEKALYWLAYYAEEVGNAFGRMKYADLNRKTVRATEYHRMTGSNTDKMQKAEMSEAYMDACKEYQNACADYMRLNILKEAAVLKIGVWQSKVKAGMEGNP